MKTRVLLIAVLAFAVGLLLSSDGALAGNGPKFLYASGQEVTFNVLDPGTATCIGGEATGDPYDPCHGSHRVMLRHQVVQAALISATGDAAPLLAGLYTLTADCNLDGNLAGTCWGTFEWQVDEDSLWAGTMHGSFDFSTFAFAFQMVGNGFGGAVDGMQLQYDVVYDGGYDFVGDFVARVHSPKG